MKRQTDAANVGGGHPPATRPRLGVVGLAYGGYHLGEELGPAKLAELVAVLGQAPIEAVPAVTFVLNEQDAAAAGDELARQHVGGIVAVLTTFVPDYFIVELLRHCDVPIFLWAVEREMQCLSLVCGPLITATLYNLRQPYHLAAADVNDAETLAALQSFAQGALLVRLLRTARVGFCGGKCPIMFSMSVDEYALTEKLGTTIIPLPIEDFHRHARAVTEAEARAGWRDLRKRVGEVTAAEADGVLSTRYYLAARRLVAEQRLDALSLNCFPHLKSQVCLAVARLNDDGIAAACEGDLHSTLLMHLLSRLTGRAAFNGDLLRLYADTNDVLFSHCGAGAFSLAAQPREVCLRCSIETHDGLAVCYATSLHGPVTLLNLMMGRGGLRLAGLGGEARPTDLSYEGTPLRVHFTREVKTLVQRVAQCGAGHHWNGANAALLPAFRMMCELQGVAFTDVGE